MGLIMETTTNVETMGSTQLIHCCRFCSNVLSQNSVSEVKRLRMRPEGVVSKKRAPGGTHTETHHREDRTPVNSDRGGDGETDVYRDPEVELFRWAEAPFDPVGEPHVGERSEAAVEAAEGHGQQQEADSSRGLDVGGIDAAVNGARLPLF
eukprot:scaffold222399_cov29-Tisochrysis_lutea.AAC.5